jgi:hypothetical protein
VWKLSYAIEDGHLPIQREICAIALCGGWATCKLHPNDLARQKVWIKVHEKRLLDKGKIEKLVLSPRSLQSANADVLEKIR